MLAAWILGPQILSWLYRPEYAQASEAFVILMTAAGVSYIGSALGYVATATRRIRYQPLVHLGSLAVVGMGSRLLVSHGLSGIAVAVFLSSLSSTLGFAVLLCCASDDGRFSRAVTASPLESGR